MLVTIDGPSGVGKGTLSLKLANALGVNILDSGALYRVIAYLLQKESMELNVEGLNQVMDRIQFITFNKTPSTVEVMLEGCSIDEFIRKESIGQIASQLAQLEEIREPLLAIQRSFNISPGLVTDGRDMGEIVFPEADVKFYLDAKSEERAKRRYLQLQESGLNVTLASVLSQVNERDQRDSLRELAPLRPPEGAVSIDSSNKTIDEVFEIAYKIVLDKKKGMFS